MEGLQSIGEGRWGISDGKKCSFILGGLERFFGEGEDEM